MRQGRLRLDRRQRKGQCLDDGVEKVGEKMRTNSLPHLRNDCKQLRGVKQTQQQPISKHNNLKLVTGKEQNIGKQSYLLIKTKTQPNPRPRSLQHCLSQSDSLKMREALSNPKQAPLPKPGTLHQFRMKMLLCSRPSAEPILPSMRVATATDVGGEEKPRRRPHRSSFTNSSNTGSSGYLAVGQRGRPSVKSIRDDGMAGLTFDDMGYTREQEQAERQRRNLVAAVGVLERYMLGWWNLGAYLRICDRNFPHLQLLLLLTNSARHNSTEKPKKSSPHEAIALSRNGNKIKPRRSSRMHVQDQIIEQRTEQQTINNDSLLMPALNKSPGRRHRLSTPVTLSFPIQQIMNLSVQLMQSPTKPNPIAPASSTKIWYIGRYPYQILHCRQIDSIYYLLNLHNLIKQQAIVVPLLLTQAVDSIVSKVRVAEASMYRWLQADNLPKVQMQGSGQKASYVGHTSAGYVCVIEGSSGAGHAAETERVAKVEDCPRMEGMEGSVFAVHSAYGGSYFHIQKCKARVKHQGHLRSKTPVHDGIRPTVGWPLRRPTRITTNTIPNEHSRLTQHENSTPNWQAPARTAGMGMVRGTVQLIFNMLQVHRSSMLRLRLLGQVIHINKMQRQGRYGSTGDCSRIVDVVNVCDRVLVDVGGQGLIGAGGRGLVDRRLMVSCTVNLVQDRAQFSTDDSDRNACIYVIVKSEARGRVLLLAAMRRELHHSHSQTSINQMLTFLTQQSTKYAVISLQKLRQALVEDQRYLQVRYSLCLDNVQGILLNQPLLRPTVHPTNIYQYSLVMKPQVTTSPSLTLMTRLPIFCIVKVHMLPQNNTVIITAQCSVSEIRVIADSKLKAIEIPHKCFSLGCYYNQFAETVDEAYRQCNMGSFLDTQLLHKIEGTGQLVKQPPCNEALAREEFRHKHVINLKDIGEVSNPRAGRNGSKGRGAEQGAMNRSKNSGRYRGYQWLSTLRKKIKKKLLEIINVKIEIDKKGEQKAKMFLRIRKSLNPAERQHKFMAKVKQKIDGALNNRRVRKSATRHSTLQDIKSKLQTLQHAQQAQGSLEKKSKVSRAVFAPFLEQYIRDYDLGYTKIKLNQYAYMWHHYEKAKAFSCIVYKPVVISPSEAMYFIISSPKKGSQNLLGVKAIYNPQLNYYYKQRGTESTKLADKTTNMSMFNPLVTHIRNYKYSCLYIISKRYSRMKLVIKYTRNFVKLTPEHGSHEANTNLAEVFYMSPMMTGQEQVHKSEIVLENVQDYICQFQIPASMGAGSRSRPQGQAGQMLSGKRIERRFRNVLKKEISIRNDLTSVFK